MVSFLMLRNPLVAMSTRAPWSSSATVVWDASRVSISQSPRIDRSLPSSSRRAMTWTIWLSAEPATSSGDGSPVRRQKYWTVVSRVMA